MPTLTADGGASRVTAAAPQCPDAPYISILYSQFSHPYQKKQKKQKIIDNTSGLCYINSVPVRYTPPAGRREKTKGFFMRIVEKTKLYAADEKLMVKLDHDGWDHYDGRNWQWYSLLGVEVSGTPIYKLDASNSGDCYGDYSTQYFTAKGLKYWADFHCKNIAVYC